MATYDLEEQEQLDEIKVWWQQYGKWVIAAVVAFVLSVAGWQGWQGWQGKQQQESAALFEQAVQARAGNNAAAVKQITAQIMDNYAGSGYATPAAWMVGQVNLEAKDTKSALAQFQFAFDHAQGAVMQDLARLRLAGLMFHTGDAEGALQTLEAAPADAYAALFGQLRGDVLVTLKRTAEARLAYQSALTAMDKANTKVDPIYAMIEMRLDALGDGA
ncbi:MAG: hypothetical protein D4R70_03235 [Betaproteobacteria bacterium]|nr:MAG: hypothetical protein D4R70_03235 [Betaproteobacteria bacterium]